VSGNLEAPEVPEKRCPECGAKAPVYELRCPLCGHEWLPSAASRGKDPAARLFVALAVALGGLLLALCVLFGIVHSYVRR
jgi:predicted amidophosphoribosyltransferase